MTSLDLLHIVMPNFGVRNGIKVGFDIRGNDLGLHQDCAHTGCMVCMSYSASH